MKTFRELQIPSFFDPEKVGHLWQVPYQARADEAFEWAKKHKISPSNSDTTRVALVVIDVQVTFCIPGFELFIGGRTGHDSVDDTRRLCEFIYRNMANITEITATFDTHTAMQIFHPVFLVDGDGNHPDPLTLVRSEDILTGRWRFNPSIGQGIGIDPLIGQKHLEHYTKYLQQSHKYDLTIWPYHAMLGGVGHALVPAFEEAVFFHTIARYSRPDFEIKGENPLTESYSAIGPEVLIAADGKPIDKRNDKFLRKVRDFDRVVVTGQAKSHCLVWTLEDLLQDIQAVDPSLAEKIYLLEDTTSSIVVPNIVDYTPQADAAFQRFAKAGMHLVRTTQPISAWPGMEG